jgi:lipid-binding SYLF domain-containing protein
MRKVFVMGAVLAAAGAVAIAAPDKKEMADRIQNAAVVLDEIHKAPDNDIPHDLWAKASCVGVLPSVKKGAFIVGGEFGKGVMSCRNGDGWSAPSFVELEKGSIGFQIGGESVDLVYLVMNENGVRHMLANKTSLGAEASAAAGPIGRDTRAMTDAQMKAEILSWSRASGVFAGVNLSGGSLRPDVDTNEAMYGKGVTAKSILIDKKIKATADAAPFIRALGRTMPVERTAQR